jgi:hypothetical protein
MFVYLPIRGVLFKDEYLSNTLLVGTVCRLFSWLLVRFKIIGAFVRYSDLWFVALLWLVLITDLFTGVRAYLLYYILYVRRHIVTSCTSHVMMCFVHFSSFSRPKHKYDLLKEEYPEWIFLCIRKLFLLCPVLYLYSAADCEKVVNVMHYQLRVSHQNRIISPCDRSAKWLIPAPHCMYVRIGQTVCINEINILILSPWKYLLIYGRVRIKRKSAF